MLFFELHIVSNGLKEIFAESQINLKSYQF